MARFHNSLYLGDSEERVSVLRDVGLDPLAYFAAKRNGLDEVAEQILEAAGMTEEDVPALASSSTGHLAPPRVITGGTLDWPSRPIGDNYFAKALANGHSLTDTNGAIRSNGEVADEGAAELSAWGNEDGLAAVVDDAGLDGEEEEEGWDLDAEVPEVSGADAEEAEVEETTAGVEGMAPGISENDIWVRNSPLAADHVAAGSFETAMQLLNRQVAAVEFAPLKPLFLSVYRASHLYIQANPSLPPIQIHARRNPKATATSDVFPVVSCSLQSIVANELQEAYTSVRKAKFVDALAQFRAIIQSMLLVVVQTDAQAQEVC
jgi:coatomer subunit alpha